MMANLAQRKRAKNVRPEKETGYALARYGAKITDGAYKTNVRWGNFGSHP